MRKAGYASIIKDKRSCIVQARTLFRESLTARNGGDCGMEQEYMLRLYDMDLLAFSMAEHGFECLMA